MGESFSSDNGRARRVLVTLVITTAAAAVTAGVALQNHPRAEAVVQAGQAGPPLAAAVASTTARVAVTRRDQWRDPWKRPAPLSESAPRSIDAAPDTLSDPSLPAAANALGDRPSADGEPASTF
jgi:hypothetical protein